MVSRPPTRVRRALIGAAGAWAAALLVNRRLRRVDGESMSPTLAPGDLVLVAPAWRVRTGDVVVVRDPREPSRETVKRVAAVAGEPADLRGSVARVPEGHLAVAGDNQRASTDSRAYGAVARDLVASRVVARLWPRPVLTRKRGP